MTFDLQAHRGGAGLHPENTLEAFGAALTLGVSTLELDVHLTRDNDVVVSHDPALADARLIRQLTRPDLPPTMPLLREVAALLDERRAHGVRVNLEIKYDAMAAAELTSRADFVAVTLDAIRIDGLVDRTSMQCFDWGVLGLVGKEEQGVRRNLLVSPKYLGPEQDGPSRWFGGLDVAEEFVITAAEQGFDAISPIHGSPFGSGVDDAAYVPFASGELIDRRARRRPAGHPVRRRRPADDGRAGAARRRRADHELSGPAPRRARGTRPSAARVVPRAQPLTPVGASNES